MFGLRVFMIWLAGNLRYLEYFLLVEYFVMLILNSIVADQGCSESVRVNKGPNECNERMLFQRVTI